MIVEAIHCRSMQVVSRLPAVRRPDVREYSPTFDLRGGWAYDQLRVLTGRDMRIMTHVEEKDKEVRMERPFWNPVCICTSSIALSQKLCALRERTQLGVSCCFAVRKSSMPLCQGTQLGLRRCSAVRNSDIPLSP